MHLWRSLLILAAAAYTSDSAELPVKDLDPVHCKDKTAAHPLDEAEAPVSLAQKSWSRGKVTFPNPQQGSLGIVVSTVLAALLFLTVFFAYGGGHQLPAGSTVMLEQPRRLTQSLTSVVLRSLSSDVAATKSTQEAAGRTVMGLRLRGIRHRLARLDEGDDGLLDDDRDAAKIAGFLAKAKEYAQRQQYEKAVKLFKKAAHMAKGMLQDLKKDDSGPVELDEAQHRLSDVFLQTTAFYLERGQSKAAKKVLKRAAQVIDGRSDSVAMRTPLLAANVLRDSGKFEDAVTAYEALLDKITKQEKGAGPVELAMLNELAAETHGELARAMISQGKSAQAQELLEKTLDHLQATKSSASQEPYTRLVARLKGWLGVAHLREGHHTKAVDVLDSSLAGLGELPAGLAGATTDVQEILQSRATAKAAMGRLHNAAEDLEVVRGLQTELMQTIVDEHNPKYAAGHGVVPDPRLWASMARTMTIAADLKMRAKVPAEALSLAREALRLLRKVKKSDRRVPKGYSLATFAEVKDLIAKAKLQQPTTPLLAEPEDESAASHVDTDLSGDESEAEMSHEESELSHEGHKEELPVLKPKPGEGHKEELPVLKPKPGVVTVVPAAEEGVTAA